MHPAIDSLNLHQLRVFQAVARQLNFSRAAEELAISQPAVTSHVKQLEGILGLRLFDKIGRRVHLTEAGQQLYEYSQRVFALLGETLQVMDELRGMGRGTLRVAADTTAGVYVVPTFLGHFHRNHPQVRITLDVTNRAQVAERLVLNQVDLAVMGQVPGEKGLVAEPFLDNELVVIAAAGHRLSGERNIPVRALAGETFVLREPGSGTRATAERVLTAAGVTMRAAMELGSNSAVKQAVANDLGIAIISRHAVALEVSVGRLTVLDVQGFPIVRHWHVVHLEDKHLPPPAAAFKRLLLGSRPSPAAS